MDAAACFACLPEDQKQTLKLQLLCEILNGGGGGGGVTSILAGTGISVDAATGDVTVTNSGVTSIIAGDGISIDAATGAVTITATGTGGTDTFWIPAAGQIPQVTNGSGVSSTQSTTNLVNLDLTTFDPATDQFVQYTVVVPSNYSGGTFTAQVFFTAPSGTGDVVWTVAARSYADGDLIDQAFGTAQSVTKAVQAAAVSISSATAAVTPAGTPAAGQLMQIQISRDANAGGDTYGSSATLIGVLITYETA